MIPFQITFQDFPESDFLWNAIQKRIEKLEHYFDRIIRCKVVISCPHRHRHADRQYHVLIHVALPGETLVINRNPSKKEAHRDAYVAIRDAFDAAERMLQNKIQIYRHETKHHEDDWKQQPPVELEEEDYSVDLRVSY